MIIREAKTSDLAVLIKQWRAIETVVNSPRPYGGDSEDKAETTASLISHAIGSDQAVVLIATDENSQSIATISGHVFEKPSVKLSRIGVIYSLWVDEDFRCKGVGQKLLNQIEKTLAEFGAEALQVAWDANNLIASSWWQKRGFASTEVIASKNIT